MFTCLRDIQRGSRSQILVRQSQWDGRQGPFMYILPSANLQCVPSSSSFISLTGLYHCPQVGLIAPTLFQYIPEERANAKANKLNQEWPTGATDLQSHIRILLWEAHEPIDPPCGRWKTGQSCGDVDPLTALHSEIHGETVQDMYREVRAATTARGHVQLVTRRETHRSTMWTMEDRTVLR